MRALPRRTFRAKALEIKGWETFTPTNPGPYFARRPNQSSYDHWRQTDLAANSVVSVALSWIRKNIHKGRLVAGNVINGAYEEIEGHPIGLLAKRPNPWDSWMATLGGTSDSLSVDGYAYWLKSRDGLGSTLEVTWVPNFTIEPIEEVNVHAQRANGPIRGYWYTSGSVRRWYEPSEVVHFRNGRDPLCRWQGISDLKVQIRNVAGVDAAERYTAAVLRNAHAGKVLSPKDRDGFSVDMDEPAINSVADRIERGTTGENVGRITRSNLPVDVTDLGIGPADMSLDSILDLPVALILASLGLNMLTLNLPGGHSVSTFANKAEARREAWEQGVIPLQDLMADEIQAQLLPDFGDSASECWWDRKDVEALREDANERMARARMMRPEGNLGTFNETRTLIDLPPIDGGDKTPVEEEEERKAEAEAIRQSIAANPDQEPVADDGEDDEDDTDA